MVRQTTRKLSQANTLHSTYSVGAGQVARDELEAVLEERGGLVELLHSAVLAEVDLTADARHVGPKDVVIVVEREEALLRHDVAILPELGCKAEKRAWVLVSADWEGGGMSALRALVKAGKMEGMAMLARGGRSRALARWAHESRLRDFRPEFQGSHS